jgi:hypothetical protein
MRGSSHVRFLGGPAGAIPPGYPGLSRIVRTTWSFNRLSQTRLSTKFQQTSFVEFLAHFGSEDDPQRRRFGRERGESGIMWRRSLCGRQRIVGDISDDRF